MSARRVAARAGGGVGQPAWLAWVLPAVLVSSWTAMAAAPQISGTTLALLVALVGAVGFALILFVYGGDVERGVLAPLLASGIVMAVFGLSVLNAANPSVAFAGLWAARTSWVMWALALGVMALSYLAVSSANNGHVHLRRIAITVAILGAVSALAAIAEALGVLGPAIPGWSEKPAGVFENAQSLAQILVVAAGCAAAWFSWADTTRLRAGATAILLLCGAGILLTEVRGALLGAVVGGLVMVLFTANRSVFRSGVSVLLGLFCSAYVTLLVVAVQLPRQQWATVLDDALTGRLTLWHSMLSRFVSEPLLGRGPMNVSAYTTWGVDADLVPMGQVTFDPHSLPVYLLVSSGVLGASAVVLVAWSLGRPLWASARPSPEQVCLAAACSGWLATTAFTWASPFGLLLVAAVAGVLAGSVHADTRVDGPWKKRKHSGPPVQRVPVRALASFIGIVIALCALAFAPYALAEMRWTAAMQAPPAERFELAEELARQTRDPSYAVRGIVAAFELAPDDTDRAYLRRALDLAREFEGDSSWHVSLAYNDLQVHAAAHMLDEATLDELRAAITRARRADPASGYFDFIAAEALLRLGYTDLAPLYARRSLEFPQTPETRAILEDVIAGRPVGDTSAQ